MVTDPQTHHATCYREHHACAVARLDALGEAMAWMPSGPWVWDGDSVCAREDWCLLPEVVAGIAVAVRDITEGR